MISHRSPISGIAADGGTYVATAGYDNQVILWDRASHRAVARAFHDHLANHVTFSPDGRYLLTSSSDYSARLWRLPDLRLVSVFAAHDDDVEMAAFHPTRELVATASRDHTIGLYAFDGSLRARLRGHTADVISVAWSADGSELVSSSDDGRVKRWSPDLPDPTADLDMGGVETDTIVVTGTEVVYAGNDEGNIVEITGDGPVTHPAHSSGVKRLVHDVERGRLVSLSYDRTVKVWSLDGGLRLVATSLLPAQVWPRSCAFVDADTLVFATFGTSYATHHVSTGAWDLSHVADTPGLNAVTTLDGAVLTIGDAGVVYRDGTPLSTPGSLCNFLSPVGSTVVTGGQLGIVFDAVTGLALYQHRSPLNCAAEFTAADGSTCVVVGTYTGEGIVLARRPDGTFEHRTSLPLHANAVKGVAVAGGLIFAVCADTGVSWFDTDSLAEVGRLDAAHDRIANGCAALPDGRFVSVSRDRSLRIWSGLKATEVPSPHNHSIKCVAASADGTVVATGAYNGDIALYSVTGQRWHVEPQRTASGVSSLHFDAVGNRFLASSYDGSVYEVEALVPADSDDGADSGTNAAWLPR